MTFTQRIYALPLLAALVFIAVTAITYRDGLEQRQLSVDLQDMVAEFELSLGLENSLLLVRQAHYSAAKTNLHAGLQDAEDTAGRFRGWIARGRETFEGKAAALDSADVLFESYMASAGPAFGLMAKKRSGEIDEAAVATITHSNDLYGRLATMLQGRTKRSHAAVHTALAESSEGQRLRQRAMLWSTVIGFAVLASLSGAILVSVLRPLRTIMRGTEAIAAGNLYQEINYESGDILGHVADSFRRMQRSLIRDLNERKRAESALRSSQERLELAFEAAHEGLWDYSIPDREMYFSPRYYVILGFSEAEARIVPNLFELCRPGKRAAAEALWRSHIVGGEPLDTELEIRRRDGAWVRLHVRGRIAELHADGQPLRSIGTIAVFSGGNPLETRAESIPVLAMLSQSLSTLLSSAEIVANTSEGNHVPPQSLDILKQSRNRTANVFSALVRVTELEDDAELCVSGREVVQLAAVLANRSIEPVDDGGRETVFDPASAVRQLAGVLTTIDRDPVSVRIRVNRERDQRHEIERTRDETVDVSLATVTSAELQ